MNVTVIGAGLAGSEAAWQLAERGIQVTLCEFFRIISPYFEIPLDKPDWNSYNLTIPIGPAAKGAIVYARCR